MRLVVLLLVFLVSSCAGRGVGTSKDDKSPSPQSLLPPEAVLLLLEPSPLPPSEPPLARFIAEGKDKSKRGAGQSKGQADATRDARALALAQILRDRRKVSHKRDGRLVIGLLLPQKRFPALAKSMEQAAKLALSEEDRFSRVKLIVRDSGEQPSRARRSATQLLSQQADILIGPVFSAQSLPVAAVADRARKPLLTFSNDEKVEGKFVYRFGLSVREQTSIALQDGLRRPPQAFDKEQNKRHRGVQARWGTRVAVLVPQNGYGRLVVQASNAYLRSRGLAPDRVDFLDSTLDYETLGGQIRNIADFDYRMLALAQYKKQRRRVRAQLPQDSATGEQIDIELKKLEKQDTYGAPPFDILLLPEARQEALQVVSSYLALYDIDAYLVGIYGLASWGQMRNLSKEPQLRGSRFVFLKRTSLEDFAQRFQNYTGSQAAVHTLTVLAYDATQTAARLGAQKGYVSREDLERAKGFAAAAGRFRLRADGEVQRIYEVREITRRGDKTLASQQKNFLP